MEVLFGLLESIMIAMFLYLFNDGKYKWYVNSALTMATALLLFVNLRLSTKSVLFSEYTFIIDLVIIIIFVLTTLKVSVIPNVFSVVFCYITLIATNVISIQLVSWISEIDTTVFIESGTIYRKFAIIFSKILWAIVLMFAIFVKKKWGRLRLNLYELLTFFLMGGITIASTSGIMMLIRENELMDSDFINRMHLILVGLLVLDLIIGGLMIFLLYQKRKTIEMNFLRKSLDIQKDAYQVLLDGYNKHRKLSHDVKNVLLSFRQMIEDEDWLSLKDGVNQTIGRFIEDKNTKDSNVNMWTSIIEYKRLEAQNKKIIFDVKISSGDYSNVSGMDLCIILGNLLDNAIEAEEKEIKQKKIELRVAENFGIVYISVKNFVSKPVLNIKGEIKTSKAEKIEHGFGLKSVQEIVKKYNGNVDLEDKDNYFNVEVMLYK